MKIKKPPTRSMGSKPHIRMQKLKPVPPTAFPQSAQAFPGDGTTMDPAMGGPPAGAAPGDMGE